MISKVVLNQRVEEVFRFFTNPRNITILYPPEMRVKILDSQGELKEGDEIKISYNLLGQRFRTTFKVKELKENSIIVLEALDAPFRVWRHEHRFTAGEHYTELEDAVVVKTMQGPLGDYVAQRIIRKMLDYRNAVLRRIFGEEVSEPVYVEPFRISLAAGTVLTALGTLAGLVLLVFLSTDGLTSLLMGLASFLLLWFFSHDLAHLVVGYAAGVRFSHYYIGLSNLALVLPTRLKTMPVALGLRIDRSRSKAGKLGFSAMYLAGPLASMLLPFLPPIILATKQGEVGLAGSVLLTLAAANLVFTVIFSHKVGCIRKALRVLEKPLR